MSNKNNQSNAELMTQLEALQTENEALKIKTKGRGPSVKVSDKGCVCLYGLGRFPVALYPSQWEVVFDQVESIKQCITDNKETLDAKAKAFEIAKEAAKASETTPTTTAA